MNINFNSAQTVSDDLAVDAAKQYREEKKSKKFSLKSFWDGLKTKLRKVAKSFEPKIFYEKFKKIIKTPDPIYSFLDPFINRISAVANSNYFEHAGSLIVISSDFTAFKFEKKGRLFSVSTLERLPRDVVPIDFRNIGTMFDTTFVSSFRSYSSDSEELNAVVIRNLFKSSDFFESLQVVDNEIASNWSSICPSTSGQMDYDKISEVMQQKQLPFSAAYLDQIKTSPDYFKKVFSDLANYGTEFNY